MTVQELYKRFQLMINKNDTNEGVNILPAVFVLLYNSETQRWLNEEFKKNQDNIDLNLIQKLFAPDYKLTLVNKSEDYIEYLLPDDYFQIYGSYSLVDRGPCTKIRIANFEKKPANLVPILSDEDSKPSFDYQEAPFVLANNNVRIYFDSDYTIGESFLNYYRIPRKIDMEGYVGFDGIPSTNIDPELDDFNSIQILARVAAEVDREIHNSEGIQYDKDRINTEF